MALSACIWAHSSSPSLAGPPTPIPLSGGTGAVQELDVVASLETHQTRGNSAPFLNQPIRPPTLHIVIQYLTQGFLSVLSPLFVKLMLPPLGSKTGYTGELWSRTNLIKISYNLVLDMIKFILFMFLDLVWPPCQTQN